MKMTISSQHILQDRFRLVAKLGKGGMGTVWLAEDLRLGRAVALKELITVNGAADLRARRERAMREAKALAGLKHPAIVSVHDVILDGNDPWIVMEYINGRSLEVIMRERGRLSDRTLAGYVLPVLHALSAAHRAGVVHRDVKPGNILVEEDGSVSLVDFGIAQVDGITSMTGENVIMGTADYLAPERIRQEKAGPSADLWSVGVTLFYAREGFLPFHRNAEPGEPAGSATMRAILTEEPPRPAAGGVLDEVVVRLLIKDPARRPGAGEVAGILAAVAASASPAARVPAAGRGTKADPLAAADGRRQAPARRPASPSSRSSLYRSARPPAGRPATGRSVAGDSAVIRGAGTAVGTAMLLDMSPQRAAEILVGCGVHEGGELLQGIAIARPGTAGEILEILSASVRTRFMEYLNPETAASVLAVMDAADAAAHVLAPLIRADADLAAAAIMNLPANTAVGLIRAVIPHELAFRLIERTWESYVQAMEEVDPGISAWLRRPPAEPVGR
jgi:predicted Ser/Thr protein kinase